MTGRGAPGTGREVADLLAGAFAASPLAQLVASASGTVRLANEATGRILGRPLDAVMGHDLGAFVDPAQRSEMHDLLARAARGDAPHRHEMRFVRGDGGACVCGFSVAPMTRGEPRELREPREEGEEGEALVVIVLRDVTDEIALRDALRSAGEAAIQRLEQESAQRREAEGVRARLEGELQQLLGTIPEIAIVHRDGRIVHVNDVAVLTLGHRAHSDLVGRLLLDLADPAARGMLAERMRGPGPTDPAPAPAIRLMRRDGSFAEIELVAMPIVFQGQPAQLMLGRDATERRTLEARLVMTDRLASLGTLAAGVAHEINNPLAYVTSNLELLTEELRVLAGQIPDSTTLREMGAMVSDARQGAERVTKIVVDLKAFSRAGREERGPVELRGVLEQAIKMTWNEIRHRARLTRDWKPVPLVDADEARLGQVFINLLLNAAQAIPEGHVDENAIDVSTSTDGEGRAVVEITDSGKGIPPALRSRIFDPFFTTKPVGVGTGLGLSICHGIVTSFGGEISVQPGPRRGTTFRVALPGMVTQPSVAPQESAPPLSARGRGRVLIIDDDVLVGVGLRRLLSREHDVTLATSGEQGLEMVRAGPAFDVILCDLMLPDLTGMDLHAEVRRSMPGQAERFVFMTGGAFTAAAREFLDKIPNRRFDKPFQAEAVRALVRQLLH